MGKEQDILKIYKNGTTTLNGMVIEKAVWEIKDGILTISGDAVISRFNFEEEITDTKELQLIEESFIKTRKSLFYLFTRKKIRYVPDMSWYNLIERRQIKVMSSNFHIIELKST